MQREQRWFKRAWRSPRQEVRHDGSVGTRGRQIHGRRDSSRSRTYHSNAGRQHQRSTQSHVVYIRSLYTRTWLMKIKRVSIQRNVHNERKKVRKEVRNERHERN